ncbi:ornithine aminotransferase [soil metagenome]
MSERTHRLRTDQSTVIEETGRYGAKNYRPLPVVVTEAEGCWVTDVYGNQYLDMLSAYSALNQGHRHPKIVQALKKQADRMTLTSRAFYNDKLNVFYKRISGLTGKDTILPMNTGAEAVETAIKAARRWGNDVKGIADGKARIIACEGNSHGRTLAAISLSSEAEYRSGFGPLLPGIEIVPYGDTDALEEAIEEDAGKTAAFIVEPIQGEAGIIMPPPGFLTQAKEICERNNVLFVADEIQAGLCRTGRMFACEWEGVQPDIYILGKALGGGIIPISCVAADRDILEVFGPGSHGSTLGGNPLACAVAIASLEVLEEEGLAEKSERLGKMFLTELKKIENPIIKEVRGRGLMIGVELTESARPYCNKLKEEGVTVQRDARERCPLLSTTRNFPGGPRLGCRAHKDCF